MRQTGHQRVPSTVVGLGLALILAVQPVVCQAADAATPAAAAASAAADNDEEDEPTPTPVRSPSPKDPWEGFNRAVFSFNETLDEAVLKPVAEGYRKVLPSPVRTGISNFLDNIGDVWSAANHLLQGKVMSAGAMTLRVATNTVFGLGGLLDPASEMGLERQPEDLGQTLGVWGVPPGPYVMLPFLGPSTLRDTVATPVDRYAGPTALVSSTPEVVGVASLQLVSTRAGLLGASNLLDQIALDKYGFLRDLYLSRRRSQVYDGNPPEEPDPEDDEGSAKKP